MDYALRAFNNAEAKVPALQLGVPEEQQERMTYEKFRDEFGELAGADFLKGADEYLRDVYNYIDSQLAKKATAQSETPAEQPRAAVGETETKEPEKGGKGEKVKNEAAAPKAKIDDAGEREKAQREVEQIASKLEKGNTTKNDELIQRIADMAQEADEALESGNLTDEERLRQQARFDVADAWLENNVRGHRADIVKPVTKREARLRDAIVDLLRKAGIDVVTESEEGQRVLDMANGRDVTLNKAQKRILETAPLIQEEGSRADISSIDGAKVLKNLDILAEKLEKSSSDRKNFLQEVGNALNAKQHGSKSQYATFETKNGQIVTIRLGNHNATVSRFDNNGEDNGISIVISRRANQGITNDGNAHLVEYFYSDKAINRAEGKPLADIVRSIKQALYSGEYKDTTGLAEREEVNAEQLRMHRVYHGSGADFERFDHSHMGEGEGAQSFGWGTYVTEVEGIGKKYANDAVSKDSPYQIVEYVGEKTDTESLSHAKAIAPLFHGGSRDWNGVLEFLEQTKESPRTQRHIEWFKKTRPEDWKSANDGKRILYTVEIPEDNGSNYLEWNEPIKQKQLTKIASALAKEKGKEYGDYLKEKKGSYGENIYYELYTALGSQQAASELLHSAGFVGVKYPAEYYSGGRADGAKNYVIFDESDLQITDKVKFFRTENGEAYGFTMGGKIYLDPKIATAETPIHEYTHLWAEALRAANPKAWEQLKSELEKDKDLMAYVQRLYPEYYIPRPDGHPSEEGTGMEDELMDEVFAHFSGRRGAERLREEQRKAMDEAGDYVEKAGVVAMFERLRDALKKFWNAARDLFAGKRRGIKKMSAEDFADMVLGDLVGGFKLDRGDRVDRSDRERDAEYMEAVNRGDMETAQRMADEAAREAGYISENDFRMRHTAPNGRDGFSRSIDDVSGIYPEDLYRPNGYHYYGDGDVWRDRFSANVFSRVRNNPDALVKIYRAVPKTTKETKLRNGDWVSVNREYAKEHGERNINGGYKIIEDEVPAKYVYTDGNSLHEQGYDDGKEYVYQNTKNNRKLIDPVTYDDAGNVIPLSKRFNKRNADIRYEKVGGNVRFRGEKDSNIVKDALIQLEEGYRNNDKELIEKSANALQGYVDNDVPMPEFDDEAINEAKRFTMTEDPIAALDKYKGDNPHILAYQYLQRLFWDRYLDTDEDQEYIKTGIKTKKTESKKEEPSKTEAENEPKQKSDNKNKTTNSKIKSTNKTEPVVLTEENGNYVAFNDEAVSVSKATGLPLIEVGNIKKVVFPVKDLPKYIKSIVNINGSVFRIHNYTSYYTRGLGPFDSDGNAGSWITQEIPNKHLFRSEEEPVFYSNAMRAVENIKQERATPEQWLKMIEKQGGMKAGEDKWLGLSEWLKGMSDRKDREDRNDRVLTLTKQEVLDYIRANEIQVEEVEYGSTMSDKAKKRLEEYNNELLSEIEELDSNDKSGGEVAEMAFGVLVDRYGDDFENAFELTWEHGSPRLEPQRDVVDGFVDEAKYFLDMDGDEVRQINSTRLSYTTEGLDNKREIVLTVPTIEPWNEHDEVHFGEAGGGRAVAWVRFGETTDADGKRVLVIDEIQSKRHQEGREKGYREIRPHSRQEANLRKAVNDAQDRYDEYTRKMGEKYGGAYVDIYADMSEEDRKEADRLENAVYEADAAIEKHYSAIPDAPFEKNWHEVAMKRMLRFAAENGYDKVAWTKGEQQAERYNIGNVISHINMALPINA